MRKFHVFYTWAYGSQPKREEYTDQDALLDLVRKAKEPESPYWGFTVIYGEQLDFEPFEKITAWKIKDDYDE